MNLLGMVDGINERIDAGSELAAQSGDHRGERGQKSSVSEGADESHCCVRSPGQQEH